MKYLIIFILFIVVGFTACRKDYLQRDLTVVQTKEDVFSNGQFASQYADASYEGLMFDYGRMKPRGQPFQGTISEFTDESVASNLEACIVTANKGAWVDEAAFMEASAQFMPAIRADQPWIRCFKAIRNANVVLANIDKVPWDSYPNFSRDLIVAQQYALRAYCYIELARRWGGMQIYDTEIILDEKGESPDLDIPRASFQETVDFILSDLDKAEQIFSTVSFSDQSGAVYNPQQGWNPGGGISANNGRVDLGAVRGLRSRILLLAASPLWNSGNDVAKWQAAADAAKEVMDMNRYSLHPTYRDLLEVNNSNEYIFYKVKGRRYGERGIGFIPHYVMSTPRGGNILGIVPTQNHVDLYEMTNGMRISDPGSGYSLANPYTNRDPRLTHNVLYNGHPWQTRPIETWVEKNASGAITRYGYDVSSDAARSTATGYICRKYWPETMTGTSTSNGLLNYVILRYGEILLNYAEAINEAGNPALAAAAINQLRARSDVNMPTVQVSLTARGQTLNQTNMRDFIRNERAVELAFEESRWFDVMRWKAGNIITQPMRGMEVVRNPGTGTITYTPFVMADAYQKVFEEHFSLYPIPRSELVKSAGALVQNPGWPNP